MVTTGQTSSCSCRTTQPRARPARSKARARARRAGSAACSRRRSTRPDAAAVHRVGRSGERLRHRPRDAPRSPGRTEDRGVIAVVRRREVDDLPSGGIGVAPDGVAWRSTVALAASSASTAEVHERHDPADRARSRGASRWSYAGQVELVRLPAVGIPPGAVPGPAAEGRHPRGAGYSPSQVARGIASKAIGRATRGQAGSVGVSSGIAAGHRAAEHSTARRSS